MMNRRQFLTTLAATTALIPAATLKAYASSALAQALSKGNSGDWDTARAEARRAGPLGFDIVEWNRLRAGEGTFADYLDFATRRADWPGMALLRRKGEDTLDGIPPGEVIRYFQLGAPQTGTGALALIAAHLALGQKSAASDVARTAWRNLAMSADEQAQFVQTYPTLIAGNSGGRMQNMLDRGELTQARQMLSLVSSGTRAVAEARIALQARADGVDALVAAVPDYMVQRSAGLARDRAWWRWRAGLEDGAAELILERSDSAADLEDPALWARLRGYQARWDLRNGNTKRAYQLAASHRLTPGGADFADLEWVSGYAALKLGDPTTALRHFQALEQAVDGPISSARAHYWQGRAYEVLGQSAKAQAAWTRGAGEQTAYYGLLSAERLGRGLPAVYRSGVSLPNWHEYKFRHSSVFQAAELLYEADERELAARFILHLEESLGPGNFGALSQYALERKDDYLALVIGKRADAKGETIPQALWPIPPLTSHDLGVPEALVLAVARRESQFSPGVASSVGAQGLMQLMPGTAKMMARKAGMGYSHDRLTADPTYNLQLGGAYLAELREDFDNSVVLVAAGYNAGPGRSRRWIEEQGDPRIGTVDVIDWVEMIPFHETRNYVMRVSEAIPPYRARLHQEEVRFTDILRGRAD
ncbi:tail length tape measure protein [Thioclava dalianensis]|uniref:Tail length tape measure protein n=2 Tax=Thioclava dalianensis TaxID=1185766 RepID=A0A074TAA4_9RHOB|nr:lytic transglycosylase domain-containing protein [Thioclava dalianensis]KEP68629.1 tail length tape measure protein [Thioclava dalianensis]SFN04396.1 soluble lytic murein transglycosylase [Thioclava dalianensis]